ncbi:MAG: TIGR04076 family protein [Anaerolineaceae bacterium]|nr:TIGR04076 family protein [Anaerolineaceae bacterium]
MSKCKITVVKRTINQDLIDEYVSDTRKDFGLCQVYEDGQEFVVENFPSRPDGFCDWAWADIQRDVVAVMFGGSFPWIQDLRTAITCCTDGFRPVIFKVEMIE